MQPKKKEKNLEINKEKKLFPMLALSYGFEEGVCLFTGVFVWATFAFIFYWRCKVSAQPWSLDLKNTWMGQAAERFATDG